jgi:hypothetical protein
VGSALSRPGAPGTWGSSADRGVPEVPFDQVAIRGEAEMSGTTPVSASPALLSLWYLAASLAEHGDRLEYHHPLVTVRNSVGLILGSLDIMHGAPGESAVVRGDGWWARAVRGTAAAGIEPTEERTLALLWVALSGKVNSLVLLPPEIRFRRIGDVAAAVGVTVTRASRLLSWTDVVQDFFAEVERVS